MNEWRDVLPGLRTTWPPRPLKRSLALNDSGVWGEEADPEEDGTLVLRSTDIGVTGNWTIERPARRRLTSSEERSARLMKGDLLVVTSSGSELHLGKTAIVDEEVASLGACFSNFTQRLRPGRSHDPRFIWYLLNSDFGREQLVWLGSTTTGLRNLNGEILGQVVYPGPPTREERHIADFLDRETARVDRVIERKALLAERLEERLNALVSRAFEGDGSLGVRLKHVISEPLKYGANEAGTHEEQAWPRFIRTTDVTDDGELRDDTFKSLPPQVAEKYMLEDGDLLLTRSGATVGKAIRYQAAWGPACFAGYMIRARPDRRKVIPGYLEHFARSASYWQQVDVSIWQATIQNISAERYGNFVLPLPSVSKQERIVRRLDEETRRTKELIGSLASQMDLLMERRQALITAAVTGELDVARAS